MKPTAHRTVKPRKKNDHPWLPIIAVSRNNGAVLVERTGEVHNMGDIARIIRREASSLLVCPNVAWLLWELDRELEDDPSWQFRVAPVRRDVFTHRQGRKVQMADTIVHYFGFRGAGKKRGHWHYPLDPIVFSQAKQLGRHAGQGLENLLAWGRDVREWCQAQGIAISATSGGIAGQLLRDSRFYPQPRRKVPRATNTRARFQLPGNHYQLFVPEKEVTHAATYLDMRSAHHNAALNITFPSADGLYARGNFHITDDTDNTFYKHKPWKAVGSPSYRTILEETHGLLLLRLTVPTMAKGMFPPPYMERPGLRLAWVYTNEIPMIRALGGIIDGIEAAWTSYLVDEGLHRYAQFALAENATANETRAIWLKPTLLAAYGILAATPRVTEWAYKRAEHGERRFYPAGHGLLEARAHRSLVELEMPTCNVIQRGMIEAETRMQCLNLARDLHRQGHRILSIYADSVIIEGGRQLPLLPPPWEVKRELTRLQFFNATSFTSRELTKLPGVPREGVERLRRLQHFRRSV